MYQILPTNQELMSAGIITAGIYFLRGPVQGAVAGLPFLGSFAEPVTIFVIALGAQKVSQFIHA